MTAPGPFSLRLVRNQPGGHAHALGLQPGDLLDTVDGLPLGGTARGAIHRLSLMRGRRTLALRRDGQRFTVVGEPRRLGPWEAAEPSPPSPPSPAGMKDWQVMTGPDGMVEVLPLQRSVLALVAPPVWLAAMRMWTALATFGTVAALSFPGGALAFGVVWFVGGIHLWRNGPALAVDARAAAGWRAVAVVPAPTEQAALAAWQKLSPEARFRYSSSAFTPMAEAA